jgi:type IV secretory pathway TraG/TraD family ATPase VirD4
VRKVELFEGDQLYYSPPNYNLTNVRASFRGLGPNNYEVRVPLNEDLFGQHMLFLGGIGMGKTNALFQITDQIINSLTDKDVMVIFDTKGDFYNEFYKFGDIVISNDDKAVDQNGNKNFWNILFEIDKGEHIDESIVEIAKSLFRDKTENSNQPFFPNAAKDIFSGLLFHAISSGEIRSNFALRQMLDNCDVEIVKQTLSNYENLRAITSYISDPTSPQTQGVISELQQMSREILIGNFKKIGNLSMRELVRNKGGKVIFIEYDLGLGNMLTPIYRLLFDLAIKEALSRSKTEGNIWLLADEFRLLPHLQHLEDAVNFGRSLGVKFLIGLQNVEQVKDSYGQSKATSILSAFLTNVIFRVNDAPSREYARGLFGKNRKMDVYTKAVQTTQVTQQVRDANVVEDWDITRLRRGQAIIGLPGEEPFIFTFLPYK